MARSSSSTRSRRPLWQRRLRRLAVVATLVGLVHLVRALMLRQDQQQFEQRYPRDGRSPDAASGSGSPSDPAFSS